MRRKSTLLVVLGVLLLAAAAGVAAMSLVPGGNGLLAAAPQEEMVDPLVPVVVAQLDLSKGTLIDAPEEFLSISEVPASQFDQATQFNDLEALRDMVTMADIKAGDTLRKSAVREAGLAQKIPAPADGEPSLKAFPVQVNSLSGVADLIAPGDFVDVLASFPLDVTTFYPDGEGGLQERTKNQATTKALLQDVEVLDVVKAAAPTAEGEQAEPTPAPSAGTDETQPDNSGNTLKAGNWIIVVAVTDQEAEILRFTLNHGINLTTILRRAGDHTDERTVGATMQLLMENYGLPVPSVIIPDRLEQAPPVPSATSAKM